MKLISLKISSKFRSLQDGFNIHFRKDPLFFDSSQVENFNPFCFVGLNGSGKSNVLEALGEIFHHLDCCALPKNKLPLSFKFRPEHSRLDDYQLEYYINKSYDHLSANELYHVRVTKLAGLKPTMEVKPYPFSQPTSEEVSTIAGYEIAAASKVFLPDLIIGYSSGENEILSLPFIKSRFLQYDEYIEAIQHKLRYKEPESRLLFIDTGMSQAVLLTNLLFQSDHVLQPLKDEMGIIDMQSFRMNINLHRLKLKEGQGDSQNVNVLNQLRRQIGLLKKCTTCWFQSKEEPSKLILDFFVNEATKRAFRHHFKNPFNLFRLFQTLYVLNNRIVSESIKADVYQSKGFYTDGKIPHPAPSDHVFYFLDFFIRKQDKGDALPKDLLLRSFSDGEHQFLHTLGICLMLKNHRTLLLLDEPETHFNPSWRGKFIKILRNSVEAGGSPAILSDIVMTSHSPFIISDCKSDFVHVFTKTDNGVDVQTASDLNIKTFGTAVDILTDEIFNKSDTIADDALELIETIRSRTFASQIDIQQAKDDARVLGESTEKILLFRELLLREAELNK